MTREEQIQEAKDKTFPTPKEGRSYESAWAAGGFEMGAHWADEHPISDCHSTIRLHKSEYDTEMEFIEKMKKLRGAIDNFIEYLESKYIN